MSAYLVLSAYFFAVLASGPILSARGGRTRGGEASVRSAEAEARSISTRVSGGAKRSPVALTERGSAVLVWLQSHPRPGTPASRSYVRRRFTRMVFRGLRLSGTLPAWACLHEHEGSWTSNTGNGYWGGLQFDSSFMGTYGSEYIRLWGTADRWPVLLQIVAAYRAYHGYHGYGARGFTPWGTRRMCGL